MITTLQRVTGLGLHLYLPETPDRRQQTIDNLELEGRASQVIFDGSSRPEAAPTFSKSEGPECGSRLSTANGPENDLGNTPLKPGT